MTLLGAATPVGLVAGAVAWFLAGGTTVRASALETVHVRLDRLRAQPQEYRQDRNASAAPLLMAPLFALTTGPGAVREPSIRIDGISVTKRRSAVLVSIDEKPPEWVQFGETRDGVTIQNVVGSSVTVETPLGSKTIGLGDQSAASAPVGGVIAPVAQAPQDRPPPGFRSPPEPASAPATR